nr:UDP-N-acetylglucosamine--dolichyl-phosphate N-acetylglucosaminephosphotransferase [Seculamonas ecuadoriensis]
MSLLSHSLVAALLAPPTTLLLRFLTLCDRSDRAQLVAISLLSALAWRTTVDLVPVVARRTFLAGLAGRDINKAPPTEGPLVKVPESLGIVPGCVFVLCSILFQVYLTVDSRVRLVEYNAALASICFMLLLGFADDVLDLPWRVKLVLPAFGSLPLLVAYSGSTLIVVPKPLRDMLGPSIDLGLLYKLYMCMLSVFCTNSINILAGLNGLEAGQSLIIAVSVAVHNLIELYGDFHELHMFSLCLMIPFIAVTLGLLKFNWFPSRVFVGDTFCYFAGVTFAVVGILGHFSKTLLLFFVPQILNFLYSVPQLVWLPCPRHRLPKLNPKTGKLEGIKTNLNLVNLFLVIFGPMTERGLCIALLAFQVVCCAVAFVIRYYVSTYFF